MNTKTHLIERKWHRAFTLLEVLMVVVVIFILAALLLPVVEKARTRSRQAQCVSQMRQIGIGYQIFSHEHDNHFPFQLSTNQGGTLEFVQAGERMSGGVQFAYRHFQPISNDLQNPTLLVCPADQKPAATTFSDLQNRNVSYFVGVTADYSKPDSILAGDGNIAGDGDSGGILRLSGQRGAYWTQAGHNGRGNLLFADGHVEQTTKAGLNYALGQQTGPVSAWMPIGSASASGSGFSGSPPPPPPPQRPGGGGGGGGSGGGSGSGGGGVSSGFAALQNYFQSPTPVPSSVPSPDLATPPAPTLPPPNRPPPLTEPVPQPMAAAAPEMAAKPVPKPPQAASELPELATSEPTVGSGGQTPVNMFMVFMKPERCWYCWVIILVLGLTTAFLLGMEIRRRRAQNPQPLRRNVASSRFRS